MAILLDDYRPQARQGQLSLMPFGSSVSALSLPASDLDLGLFGSYLR